MLTVHLRINDADTGRPTPVRLRIVDAQGHEYAPLGRRLEFPLGRGELVGAQFRSGAQRWCAIDGSCEIRLPAQVPLTIEVSKGPEYELLREEVILGAGQISLRMSIRRVMRTIEDRWMSGEGRCHYLSPHDAWLEGKAEGLGVVNLLVAEHDVPMLDGHVYPAITNMSAFSGQSACLAGDGTQVVVNTHHVHPTLGRLSLLHTHRMIFPLGFGGHEDTDDWSLADWCDQGHRKKGLVVWTHAFRPDSGMIGGEALIDVLLGKVDAIEYDGHEATKGFVQCWYRILNAGISLPLIGSSGKDSNRTPLGGMRTYAQLLPDADADYRGWIEAVRTGRTFVTNGPFLNFRVDGHGPGSCLSIKEGQPIVIEASVGESSPVDSIELIANGQVIASGKTAVSMEQSFASGTWLAARCWGTQKSKLHPAQPTFAHSSPVYIAVPGTPTLAADTSRVWLTERLESVRDWVSTCGRFTSERRKENLLTLCDNAHAILASRSWR